MLIANRGEIACRVIRTCEQLGIKTVAVFSEADRGAMHTKLASEAHCIGEPEARGSYLNGDKIITVAKQAKAEAIHPGYGFLSENSHFAAAVKKAGLKLIGPSAAVIELMGDKLRAKELAQKAGVPIAPSRELALRELTGKLKQKILSAIESSVGFPMLVKAAAGGGGRGMRRVMQASELEAAIEGAAREAESFFQDGRVFVERLIEPARHIEVQIIADEKGFVGHLFDRDCTMQRRHQKVIEEAPAPQLPTSVREKILDAAVALCREARYTNAGTVEFLLDTENNFYFMEVNSRLQVEHPVTELITGLDLVALQLRAAAGESIEKIVTPAVAAFPTKVAIECRLCAEIPEEGFVAATGKISEFTFGAATPTTERRIDTGFCVGDTISHYYDSLIAKVIISGSDRDDVINGTRAVLGSSALGGVKTNLGFLNRVLDTAEFKGVTHHIKFAETILPTPLEQTRIDTIIGALAMVCCVELDFTNPQSPWSTPSSFRIGYRNELKVAVLVNERPVECRLAMSKTHEYLICSLPNPVLIKVHKAPTKNSLQIAVGGEEYTVSLTKGSAAYWISCPLGNFEVKEAPSTLRRKTESAAASQQIVKSPFPGKVVKVMTSAGSQVTRGDTLLILESMKMEHPIRAPISATVRELNVSAGQVIDANMVLVALQV